MLAAIDSWQRGNRVAGFLWGVTRKYLDDRAPTHAALISYYAFLSIFPLLLAFVSVLGFVLEDDPSLQEELIDTALTRIPVVGAQLEDQVQPLTGSTLALVLGVVGALWAGLGVTVALSRAFENIWDVPRLEQRGMLRARAHGLLVLMVLAAALIASTFLAGLALGGKIGPGAERLGGVAAALVVNAIVLATAFTLLTAGPRRLADQLPGVAFSAVGLLALQALGGWYVNHVIARVSETYGAFALVIGLLSWFVLGAHIILIGAEINVVARRRLWPRALTGVLEPADHEVLRRAAEAARLDPRQEVTVRFDQRPPDG
jgi:YihY family inner membrane protein